MEKELKCLKAEFTDGSVEEITRIFVAQVKDAGDEINVSIFTDTEDETDVMAFKLAMLNDLKEVGMLKAAADEGMLDDVIRERVLKLLSERQK